MRAITPRIAPVRPSSFRQISPRRYATSAEGRSNATRPNIYRDLWPSIVSGLGVAFIVYYGLSLWQIKLDMKWQAIDMEQEINSLKAEVAHLRSVSSAIDSGDGHNQKQRRWFGLW